jgi:hypothetical protein
MEILETIKTRDSTTGEISLVEITEEDLTAFGKAQGYKNRCETCINYFMGCNKPKQAYSFSETITKPFNEPPAKDLRAELRRLKANRPASSYVGELRDLMAEVRNLKRGRSASSHKDDEITMSPEQLSGYIEERVGRVIEKVDLVALLKKKIKEMIPVVIGRLQGKVF